MELKESLRTTLGPLAESSLLLRGGWNTSSLDFVLADDPASDRNARQIFTELLKRVRLSQAEGEGTPSPHNPCLFYPGTSAGLGGRRGVAAAAGGLVLAADGGGGHGSWSDGHHLD